MPATKIPLNLFGAAFGLSGLAATWLTMAELGHAPEAVGDVIIALAALTWLVVLTLYLRAALRRKELRKDLTDPVAAPFASLAVIVPMIIAAYGVYPHAHTAGRVVLDVFLVLTVLLGGWFTGQWIYTPMNLDTCHPGYFLPTVAGGLVAAGAAAQVGQHRLGETIFGLGVVCWVILGSVIMGRLLFRPLVPPALLPTYAIEVAPAAVASIAWFGLNGGRIDAVAALFGGYGLLMVVAQLRLLPAYLRLPFQPSTWAFTFSWAAVATAGLHWLQALHPAGASAWQYVLLAMITAFIGAIAVRTIVAIARGQLLPKPPAAPATPEPATTPGPATTGPATTGPATTEPVSTGPAPAGMRGQE
jgi:tellurite resistance protein